jgi:Ca2+-binding RTX toxin-like protein
MLTRDENTLIGTDGDDEIFFDDIVDEEGSSYPYVVVHGMGGNDTIRTFSEYFGPTLSLFGGEGNDIINGGGSSGVLSGDAGDDTISGGSDYSDTTLFGGAGNDTITLYGKVVAYGDEGDDTVFVNQSWRATVYGGEGTDSVVMGGNGPFHVLDSIEHLVIFQGVSVRGATQQSITQYSAYQDKAVRLNFLDAANVTSALFAANFSGTIVGSHHDDILDFSMSTHDVDLTGGNGNDILKGSSAGNKLLGLNGDDTIFGGAGDDAIEFGRGKDTAWGGSGNDRFGYTDYNDPNIKAYGGTGDDVFFSSSLGAEAEIVGGSGRDIMYFGGSIAAGARIDVDLLMVEDTIVAAPETLNGIKEIAQRRYEQLTITLSEGGFYKPKRIEDGGWLLNGSKENDIVDLSESHAQRGWSNVILGKGNDTFVGTGYSDSVGGGAGNDRLSAGGGDDYCYGAGGKDILIDGAGSDTLSGGNDADTFVFHGDAGRDQIVYFRPLTDKIDLSDVSAITSFKDMIDNHVTMSDSGYRLLIKLGKDSDIDLGTLKTSELHESQFIF